MKGLLRNNRIWRRLGSAATLGICVCGTLLGADWPHWRGPFFNGSSTETNLPAHWSKTENVAWQAAMPGTCAATPIIWGDQVFISSTDDTDKALVAMALDRRTGQVRWRQKVAEGAGQRERNNYASPSPVTDGKRVFFLYGNGELVAFDPEGTKVWARNLQKDCGEFAILWLYGASPTLHEGKLYIQVLQRNVPVNGRGRTDGPIDSFILALDAATGQTLWQQVRPSDAVAEAHEAYSTPIPFDYQDRHELAVVGGDCITGHDRQTGKELWRWGTWNPQRIGHWRLVPSPVVGGGVILACAPKGDPIYAIKAGGSGVLDDSAVAWKSAQREVSCDVPTPLFYLGDFFVLGDVRRSLARVEPTGKVKWTVPAPGSAVYQASLTGADGKLYVMNFHAEASVFEAETGKLLETIPMGDEGDDMTRPTIAVARGQLFIRTNHRLYCIGKGS